MADILDQAEVQRQYAEVHKRVREQDVPTIFADAVIGAVSSGGVERLTLVREAFNPEPGAQLTRLEPVAILAMPTGNLLALAQMIITQHELNEKARAEAARQPDAAEQ